MITNERQYRTTKAWVEKFEHGAAHAEEAAVGLEPLFQQAMRNQYESRARELRAQLADYNALYGQSAPGVVLGTMNGRAGRDKGLCPH